jgi:hypothetical protein
VIPVAFEWGMMFYVVLQAMVAFIAVLMALKWNKFEFLAGLSFLFLYAILEVVDLFFFTMMAGVYVDVAQFGFILLAIIFFIVGMHPSWSRTLGAHKTEPQKRNETRDTSSGKTSVFSILRKI